MIGHNCDISIIRLEWFVTSAEFVLSILFQFLVSLFITPLISSPSIFVCGKRKQRLGTCDRRRHVLLIGRFCRKFNDTLRYINTMFLVGFRALIFFLLII